MAGGQCGLAGTHDRFGGGEVRFADFQVDHIVAGLFQRLRAGQQGHHVERSDFMAAPAVARRVGQGTHVPMVRRASWVAPLAGAGLARVYAVVPASGQHDP
jgi:hypothetical protein